MLPTSGKGTCRFRGKCRSRGTIFQIQTARGYLHLLWIQPPSDSLTIGRPLAMYTGMLRITLPSANGPGIVVLEGRLAGLWAQELLRVVREANQGPGTVFDLQEVFYVDSSGEETLRILSRVGAKFLTDSAYGKDLCKRLKLHRIASEARNSQQAAENDADCGGGHLPEAKKDNRSRAEVLGHQCSGCRK
jgi:hypothetical protein